MYDHRSLAIAVLVASSALTAPAANAVLRVVNSQVTAVGSCQPSLPAFEGLIRKRPLSVQNEGTSAAFVSCSLPGSTALQAAAIYVNSFDGQDHIVTCTTVLGDISAPEYVTKQVIAPASGAQKGVVVLPADVGQPTTLNAFYVSWSCQLPPGAGVNDLYTVWSLDVGN